MESEQPNVTQDAAPPPPTEPLVLQDWTPLMQSLDWQLGLMAYQLRGAQAFTTQEVPNLVNQGGLAAYRAAEVLFAHCLELDQAGTLEAEIHFQELAMGLGLHAVQLLDRFSLLCQQYGRDYYDRLTFWATDGTPKVLADARDRGLFSRHQGHVVLALCDIAAPATAQRIDTGEIVDLTGRLRAVVMTYALSILPAHTLRRVTRQGQAGPEVSWGLLVARTMLQHPDDLPAFTSASAEKIVELAHHEDLRQKAPLVPLYPLIDLELALGGVDLSQVELGDEVQRCADAIAVAAGLQPPLDPAVGDLLQDVWVLHSGGALRALEQVLGLNLRSDGLVLYRDYGPATAERANSNHVYQHYGPSTGTGINHFLLDRWLQRPQTEGGAGAQVTQPMAEGEASIKTRMVARAALPQTRAAFELHFDIRAFDGLETAIANARILVNNRDPKALDAYRAALQVERDNWSLLHEAGEVALRNLGLQDIGRMFLQECLRINPWYCASAWATLGDLLWTLGDIENARDAYTKCIAANPEHPRGYLAKGALLLEQSQWADAVELAGQALARDLEGYSREQALDLHTKALARWDEQRQRSAALRAQRVAGTLR